MRKLKNYLSKKIGRKILFASLGYAAKKISNYALKIKERNCIKLNYNKFKNKSEIEFADDGREFYVIPVKDFHNCIEG